MYVVYSQNESQKKFLEEQFLFQEGGFKVPLNSVKWLQDLIGKVCFEFYQHNESIFIQKFKTFLGQVLSMTFSLPLFRELLSISKKKDMASEFYRGHFLAINSILCDGEEDGSMFDNEDCEKSSMLIIQDLEQTVLSYKTLETFEMDNDMIITLQGLAESQQLDLPRHSFQAKDEKTTIFQSDKTADQTLEEYCQAVKNQRKSPSSRSEKPLPPLMAPFRLQRCFQSNILATCNKGPFHPSQQTQESMQQYINSFKKQKGNGVAQMIINQQSLGKIARKQNKDKHDRKKLQVQLYEKTKSQKSNDYNRNIRTILLNKKLRDKKSKQKYEEKSREASPQVNMKKKKTSTIQSAKQLKKPMHQVVECPQEGEYSFALGMEQK